MLTRRHIRVKVMQSLYAFHQSQNTNFQTEEKFLQKSMQEMYDLFLLQLKLIIEIRNYSERYLEKSQKKFLATSEDKDPNRKFLDNRVIAILENNNHLNDLLEERKITHWNRDGEYVAILWEEIMKSEAFESYMSTRTSTFKEDKDFVILLLKEIIAPNEKLYDYLEDTKLTWLDDLPLVNTAILKFLNKLKESSKQEAKLPGLFKSEEDEEFAINLFRKVYVNDEELAGEMLGKTPNWDKERIAEIDTILIKMAICEFLHFSSIPVKVTINEYLEIAKEYSTPKSSIFINGVLDKLSKEYQEEKRLNKIGRGLM
ncbi:transcription antitermination factor NusB [Antarcticibacterium flavum]|uniref:Transcription antitermination factor NusB n=1 Tax=Antarcticibacterium flavum TaxID=2058175 RepID=A0A5B7X7M4_9FLAO|nr:MULTISPECIES: transcription antitermination factor NusB [Antarcticibacterium]MCM4159681.1 transcription antitermination factor NusB [Antarcticibacterium sp. W02-3]QCY70621.1 transcription antitermination factor NusB [Antarcticibacterium flavum]